MIRSKGSSRTSASYLPMALIVGLFFFSALWCGAGPKPGRPLPLQEINRSRFTLVYPTGSRTEARAAARLLSEGVARVETYFGAPYPQSFTVRLFRDRRSLTAYWRQAWGDPSFESQCWMVASGTASCLALLSPSDWKREACEHDPADSVATARLITHELVHVYHGQVNPNPEFDGVEEMGWFVEGLAVSVSGQLDAARLDRARRAVSEGKGPQRLAEGWSGPDRYGIAGSMVAWLEKTQGRAAIKRMMRCTSNAEILALAGMTEQEFLASWQEWLLSPPVSRHKTAPNAFGAGAPIPSNLQ